MTSTWKIIWKLHIWNVYTPMHMCVYIHKNAYDWQQQWEVEHVILPTMFEIFPNEVLFLVVLFIVWNEKTGAWDLIHSTFSNSIQLYLVWVPEGALTVKTVLIKEGPRASPFFSHGEMTGFNLLSPWKTQNWRCKILYFNLFGILPEIWKKISYWCKYSYENFNKERNYV